MKVVQMLPTLSYGDAIGNDVLALDSALKSAGYSTKIYAENIDRRLPKGIAQKIDEYTDKKENILFFHLSIGSKLCDKVNNFKARVIIIYHNVTPPEFWRGYSSQTEKLCEYGLECVHKLASKPELCIADSGFNKEDLKNLGYTCPIETLPILINFDDYALKANSSIIKKYTNDEFVNIVFTGRIAPNKKQEDLIVSFYYYKNYINPKSRLFLVGAYNENDIYYRKLINYVEQLELNDVYFTGHIPFDEVLAYYHIADVFVCLSEHEGFCVPLVEAMYFDIPIIAYDSTAVGETLGGSGVLLTDKSPQIVAEAIHKVINDSELRSKVVYNESLRLQDFENEKIKRRFLQIMEKYNLFE